MSLASFVQAVYQIIVKTSMQTLKTKINPNYI